MWDIVTSLGSQGLALAALAVFAAALVQSLFGMGFGLFGAPMLALVDPRLVPATLLLLGFFAAVLPAYTTRGDIDPTLFTPSIVGRLGGSLIAATIMAFVITSEGFETLLGAFILLSVAVSALPWGAVNATPRNLMIAGTASGFLGTFVGVGGAPMGIVYQRERPALVRANMNAFFSVGGLVSFFVLAAFGIVGIAHLGAGLVMLPALFIGFLLSRHLVVMSSAVFRPALLSVCALSSLALVLRGLGLI